MTVSGRWLALTTTGGQVRVSAVNPHAPSGTSRIGKAGLAATSVSGRSRVPRPAANNNDRHAAAGLVLRRKRITRSDYGFAVKPDIEFWLGNVWQA